MSILCSQGKYGPFRLRNRVICARAGAVFAPSLYSHVELHGSNIRCFTIVRKQNLGPFQSARKMGLWPKPAENSFHVAIHKLVKLLERCSTKSNIKTFYPPDILYIMKRKVIRFLNHIS